MANRKPARGGAAPKAGKAVFTGVWLLVIAGAVLGFAKTNGIDSPGDLYGYSKAWSDHLREDCGMEEASFTCGEEPSTSPPVSSSNLKPKEIKGLEKQLVSIPTKPEETSTAYSRGDWPHWSTVKSSGCDARDETLLAQGTAIKLEAGDKCEAESGQWIDPYSGEKITDPTLVDIDHVIPLSYAAKNGGQVWPSSVKENFANDLSQLLASSRAENRGKGDKGPAAYMPPEKSFHCTYARIWITTATKYKLSLPTADKAVLTKALATC